MTQSLRIPQRGAAPADKVMLGMGLGKLIARLSLAAVQPCTWLASASLLVMFLGFRDLPLVDLPQHVLQISTWLHWDDATFRGQSLLEVNTHTPYVLVEWLARAMTPAIGTLPALKLLLWLGVVGNMLGISRLARKLGHDPAFALLGLLSAMGYSFFWGFVSFVFTTPLVLCCVEAGMAHAEKPDARRALTLTGVLSLLLVSHGFAFAIAFAAVGTFLTVDYLTRFRHEALSLWRQSLPLVFTFAAALLWIGRDRSLHKPISPLILDIGLHRLWRLPALILGVTGNDFWAAVFVCGIVVACELGLYQRKPYATAPAKLARFSLLFVSVAGYFLLPHQLPSTGCLYGRLVPFLLPGLLLALPPVRAQDYPRKIALFRVLCLLLTVGWVATLAVRLAAMNRETADFHAMERLMPAEQRIRPVIFDPEPQAFPGNPALLHFPAYFVAEHGGTMAYSLSMFPHMVIRYRVGVSPPLSFGREFRPELFDPAHELANFDYVLVHANHDPTPLFAKATLPVTAHAHVGAWWGYRVTHTAAASR